MEEGRMRSSQALQPECCHELYPENKTNWTNLQRSQYDPRPYDTTIRTAIPERKQQVQVKGPQCHQHKKQQLL